MEGRRQLLPADGSFSQLASDRWNLQWEQAHRSLSEMHQFPVVTSAISPFFPSLSLPRFLKSGSLPSQYLSNKLLTPQNTSHSTSIRVTCSSEFYAEPTENRRVNAKGHYTTI